MENFSDKYSRLIKVSGKEPVTASATLDLEGILDHFTKKLASVEAWLDENRSLLGDAVMQDEGSTEYAYSQLGCKLILTEVLETLSKVEEG